MRTSGRAVLLLVLYLHIEVHGEPEPDAAPAHGKDPGHFQFEVSYLFRPVHSCHVEMTIV